MAELLQRPFEGVRALAEMGGEVLYVLLFVVFAMWTLLIERGFYLAVQHPKHVRWVVRQWSARTDRGSWRARQIRALLLADTRERATRHVSMIQTLVALCPLFGLLGTVTGMIAIFDVMAVSGTGNVRAMASGVSKATIPTMVGMASALSGLFFHALLSHYNRNQARALDDRLPLTGVH